MNCWNEKSPRTTESTCKSHPMPYCVKRGQPMPMSARGGGEWFICDGCGHFALPQNPTFKGTCAPCVRMDDAPTPRRFLLTGLHRYGDPNSSLNWNGSNYRSKWDSPQGEKIWDIDLASLRWTHKGQSNSKEHSAPASRGDATTRLLTANGAPER
jgi:hypothetical protein